ncbi:MAG: SpoVK/Ycf46/Vps4 family AAA+-type ATPase [Crocinitomicaceae bacterium]|jgi:SpoVK/Ycf46/Vps4 family AAA+-type ATPase
MATKNKYKLNKLRTYTSKEWFVNEKMYRSVFLEEQTDWLRAELSLYNILFDEEDWSCTIKYEAFDLSTNKQVFEYEQKTDIPKTENVHNFRYGWGNKAKSFWKKGNYEWKAYVDNEFVGSTKFYVENAGEVTATSNPFFDIQSIRFYEEGKEAIKAKERKYMTQFIGAETRYVSTEFNLINKLSEPWHCELQYYYYDQNGRLRGQSKRVFEVNDKLKTTTFSWGNDSKDIWKDGEFTLEVVFMNQRIAIVPFTVGAQWMEGEPKISNSDSMVVGNKVTMVPDDLSLEALLAKLDELIGLTEIKSEIREYIEYLKFEKIRKEKGLIAGKGLNLHTVLTGNPGTGKTTVAKQLGKIYKAMGLLTVGHVHEVDRVDLVGEYIGQSAPKVREAIKKARGGILFIDEAYSLYREGSPKDYGHEVIEILLKEMSDGAGNLIVVCAGYPAEMTDFINSNPGLKSRFSHFFHFPDFLPEELMQIAELGFNQRELTIKEDARELLSKQLTKAFRSRDRTFGNARYVMSCVGESKRNMALRLMKDENTEKMTAEELSEVIKDDVQRVFTTSNTQKLKLQVDQELLKVAMHELDSLIGMENVKLEMLEWVKLVNYYREIGKDVLNQFVAHTVFTGNPGTGKTTVARIYAKIFRALGLIERGHLIECDREALVSGYSGQTAIKTAQMIDKAMGGVLFIDEAYSLVNGSHDSFGQEAVQTILKRMEDNNTSFILIAAGYPGNMNEFLKENPGLRSRFEKTIVFEDYSPEELCRIAIYMLEMENHVFSPEAMLILNKCVTEAYEIRDENFGNARFVRKIVQQTVRDHNLRLADVDSAKRTLEMIETITLEDMINLPNPTDSPSSRRMIGF